MKKRQIIELYSYDNWANKKLMDAVGQLENEEFVKDLLSSPTFISLSDRWNNFRNLIDNFLIELTEEDLRKLISYKNLKHLIR